MACGRSRQVAVWAGCVRPAEGRRVPGDTAPLPPSVFLRPAATGHLPSAPLKWKRGSQSGAIDHAAVREVPSFKPPRGISGTAIATLAKRLERELCEQLLHFSRAVGEP